MPKKILHLVLSLLLVFGTAPLAWSQSPPLSEHAMVSGPVSLEPAVEKNGVRVALRTSIQKKDELSVLVKISNFSDQPILVSPDAVEASTEEGFTMQLAGSSKTVSGGWGTNSTPSNSSWSKLAKVAAFIPFSDPYKIVSSTYALAQYAGKSAAAYSKAAANSDARRGLLHEVILQPGMATHGLIIYDASSLKAFNYSPTLHIKVTVGSEPFEFKFSSQTSSSSPSPN